MKLLKACGAASLAMLLVLSSCGVTNTGKGTMIGGGSGAALGAGIGVLLGGNNKGKGAAIGAGVGAAVGAGVGALIGNRMDKQQKELEAQLANANIESVTDVNGLQAIKVTFDGGILFPTNGTTLSAGAKSELANFATSLVSNPDTNVQIYGYTDNTGSMAANEKVSNGRANAVKDYLTSNGVGSTRLYAEGKPMTDYVASNETAEGRAQNRRVEIYITANEKMIQDAENGNLN
ncbi:MAG: OmpA family protein [Muribaculaceae bacterium]|nr:OmpA family protein [Muribaculaceae bacterium]